MYKYFLSQIQPPFIWADNKGFLGSGTHHTSVGFWQDGRPKIQVIAVFILECLPSIHNYLDRKANYFHLQQAVLPRISTELQVISHLAGGIR